MMLSNLQIILILLVVLGSTVALKSDVKCVDAEPENLNFASKNHELYLNGEIFRLKGVGWSGFEYSQYIVGGLADVTYSSLFDFMNDNNFNAVRLAYSVEMIQNTSAFPAKGAINYTLNPEFKGLSSIQCMDFIIDEAAKVGIMIMLDMHHMESGANTGLWFDQNYNESVVNETWITLIKRYKDKWNVFAIDVFNEPWNATWTTNMNLNTNWNIWCSEIGNLAHNLGTKWLILCEGDYYTCPQYNCFWGENLMNVSSIPIKLTKEEKLVYSPHVYGPSVYNQTYFQTNTFPSNMPNIWHQHWGYINDLKNITNALVVGEWGGPFKDDDIIWYNAFVDYLLSINQTNFFFWQLGAGWGLLHNDWVTPYPGKLNATNTLQPISTKFQYNQANHTVCYR